MFVGVALISAFLVAQTRACICPQNYEPVCCDGNQQYGNACMAGCDSATNCKSGVCASDSCICTREYDPQCCDDGNTYSNPCMAECASATNCVSGECPTVGCDGICTSYYDGCNTCQCGDNGEAGCTEMACLTQGTPECLGCAVGYALNQDTKECEVEDSCICTREYDPQCCDDGNTYSNPCMAECASATNCVSGECPTVGCDDICTSYYDGCNNCQCMDNGLATCTQMACLTQGTPECLECAAGYTLNQDTKECEVAQGCGGIPFCQSFQMDYCNACGCPNPETDPETSYCTKMSCQLREENVCTACMEGYVLNNDGAECVKPAPTPEPCMCAQIYDPVCCGGTQYGNLCSAGCAGETAACEDGECPAPTPEPELCLCAAIHAPVCCNGEQYGNQCLALCAGETTCEAGECAASRTSCRRNRQCEDPYQCRMNPECQGLPIECANDKVCYQVDGRCTSQLDCEAGFECMERGGANANRKFCIQFQ